MAGGSSELQLWTKRVVRLLVACSHTCAPWDKRQDEPLRSACTAPVRLGGTLFSPPVVGAPVDVPRVPRRTLRRSLRGAFVGCGSPSAPLVLRPFSSTALCASAVLHARGQPSLSSPTYDCLNRSQPWSHRPLTCIAGPLATRRATPTRSGPRRNTGKDPRQRSRRRRRRGRGKRPASRPNVVRAAVFVRASIADSADA